MDFAFRHVRYFVSEVIFMAHSICQICGEMILFALDHDCTSYDYSEFPLEIELHGLTLELEPYEVEAENPPKPTLPVGRGFVSVGKSGEAMPLFLRM
jgi:hypothetical protein